MFKRKKHFIIGGAIVFGLTYYGALAASSAGISRGGANSREYIPGLIPVVGPFITAGLRADPNPVRFINQPPSEPDIAGMTMYLLLGAAQAVGAGILIAGIKMPTGKAPAPCTELLIGTKPCQDKKPALTATFAPIVSPTFGGAGLTGSF